MKRGYSTRPSRIPSSTSPKLSSSYLRSELGNQAEIIQLASLVVITRFYREAPYFCSLQSPSTAAHLIPLTIQRTRRQPRQRHISNTWSYVQCVETDNSAGVGEQIRSESTKGEGEVKLGFADTLCAGLLNYRTLISFAHSP